MVDVLGRTVVVLDVLDGAAVKWWMFWAEHWYWSFWMEQLSNGGCFGQNSGQVLDVLDGAAVKWWMFWSPCVGYEGWCKSTGNRWCTFSSPCCSLNILVFVL